jgi:hypothetical protein
LKRALLHGPGKTLGGAIMAEHGKAERIRFVLAESESCPIREDFAATR